MAVYLSIRFFWLDVTQSRSTQDKFRHLVDHCLAGTCVEERVDRKTKYLDFGATELLQRPHHHLTEGLLQLSVLVLQTVDEDSCLEVVHIACKEMAG